MQALPVRPHPDRAIRALRDRGGARRSQRSTRWLSRGSHATDPQTQRINHAHARTEGADPDPPVAGLMQGHHAVRPDRGSVAGTVAETGGRAIAADPQQAGRHRAHPERSCPILQEHHDPRVGREGLAPEQTRGRGCHSGPRIEAQQARAQRADPESAVGGIGEGHRVGVAEGIRAGVPEGPAAGIPPADATRTGSDPQQACAILVQRHDVVVAQGRRFRGILPVDLELAGDPVEQVQSVGRADPEPTVRVIADRAHVRVGQRASGRIAGQEGREPLLFAIEAAQATVTRSHPQRSSAIDVQSLDLVAGQRTAVASVADVAPEPVRAGLQAVQATIGADPQDTACILRKRRHHVVAQRVAACGVVQVASGPAGGGIQRVEATARGRDPDRALAIDQHQARRIAGEAARIRWIMPEAGELLAADVEAGDPAVLDGHPQVAPPIRLQVPDEIPSEAIRVVATAAEPADRVTVEAIQPVLGRDPQEAARVLQRRHHGVLRQTLLGRQVPEHHGRCRVHDPGTGEREARQQECDQGAEGCHRICARGARVPQFKL